MNKTSITGIGLALVLAGSSFSACSPPASNEGDDGTAGAGAGAGGATGAAGGTGNGGVGGAGTCTADVTSDPFNCGMCGVACVTGQACVGGTCRLSCVAPQIDCSGVCADPASNSLHCGGCNQACASGQICQNSMCAMGSCPIANCNGACVDTQTDAANCGTCGTACLVGQSCSGGICSGGGGTGGMGGSGPTGGSGGSGPTGGSGGLGGAGGVGGGGNTGPVTVQLAQTRQKIDGFGINNTWATAMTAADADALFGMNGLGFSILRVGLGPDGNPMSANIPGDITMARQRNVTYIIGSCWSPPANCKTNNMVNDGGHVNTSCYDSWSTTIANFANTHDLYAMSIGNEPDFASCGRTEPCNGNYPTTLYTANEYVAFLKVAAPKLRAQGIKVIGPEASEWIHNWSNESATGSEPSNRNSSDPLRCGFPPTNTACNNGGGYDYGHALYRDQTAWGLLDIMGVHQYDTQRAEVWPTDIPTLENGVPPKPVWQTEMSGVKWWPEQGPTAHIDNGVAVAIWIHDALTRGMASAWLWWWWRAFDTDDNEGLYIKNGTGWTDTKRHYTLMNYSRFIRPNYLRVEVTGAAPADVLLSAYKAGTGSNVVIVAINRGTASATVPITIAGTAPAMLTPWVTSATDNFVSKTAVPVSAGTFMASLPGKTVTTFVGQ